MQKSLWEDLPIEFKKAEVNTFDRINSQTKVCNKCNTEQPIENFDSQYFRKDGSKSHRGDCRSCKQFNQKIVRNLREINGPPPDLCECCGKPPNGVTGLVTDHPRGIRGPAGAVSSDAALFSAFGRHADLHKT